ncbi:hypothetical protein SLEP1_g27752 [Rubroshorea leprosula]|uniref:Uncharacterized protein n=1 Tax=Rubroshorea leprosula TaxID=152421 RepID=A0AAV5JXF9_9ROSI|nr:hypothetical protein SLEP1_g27752 [Rubroshorea leprosula]
MRPSSTTALISLMTGGTKSISSSISRPSVSSNPSDVEVDVGGDDNDFPVERRVSGLASSGAASIVGGVEVKLEPHRESVRLVGFESDLEDDDNGALAVDLNSGDEYGMDHVDGYYEDEILRDTFPLSLYSI